MTTTDLPFDDDARFDVLIDRAADRNATLADWDELDRRAAADPTVWSWLGRAVRDDGLLRAALHERVSVADDVELPESAPHVGAGPERGAWQSLRPALGWAAAALFAVLWWVDTQSTPITTSHPSAQLGPALDAQTDATLAAATTPLDGVGDELSDTIPLVSNTTGRSDDVLAELPVLVVSTQPVGDAGRTEVVFVRRTLERTFVDDVLTVAHDEHGLPEAVPAMTASAASESF